MQTILKTHRVNTVLADGGVDMFTDVGFSAQYHPDNVQEFFEILLRT